MRRHRRAEAGGRLTRIRVRPARRTDADAIAAIYVQSAHHHRALDPVRYIIPAARAVAERYRRAAQHPADVRKRDCTTLVIERDDRVAGFVDARLTLPDDAMHLAEVHCYVAEIAVEESLRGCGLGARLLRAAEEWARGRGAVYVYLEYLATNEAAGRFYRERGGYATASVVMMKRLDRTRRARGGVSASRTLC